MCHAAAACLRGQKERREEQQKVWRKTRLKSPFHSTWKSVTASNEWLGLFTFYITRSNQQANVQLWYSSSNALLLSYALIINFVWEWNDITSCSSLNLSIIFFTFWQCLGLLTSWALLCIFLDKINARKYLQRKKIRSDTILQDLT